MSRLIHKFLLGFGTTAKDGASNLAAILIGVSAMSGYVAADTKYGYNPYLSGLPGFIGTGIIGWCTGKDNNLGLK